MMTQATSKIGQVAPLRQQCNVCGKTKHASEYYTVHNNPARLQGRCKTCHAEAAAKRTKMLKESGFVGKPISALRAIEITGLTIKQLKKEGFRVVDLGTATRECPRYDLAEINEYAERKAEVEASKPIPQASRAPAYELNAIHRLVELEKRIALNSYFLESDDYELDEHSSIAVEAVRRELERDEADVEFLREAIGINQEDQS